MTKWLILVHNDYDDFVPIEQDKQDYLVRVEKWFDLEQGVCYEKQQQHCNKTWKLKVKAKRDDAGAVMYYPDSDEPILYTATEFQEYTDSDEWKSWLKSGVGHEMVVNGEQQLSAMFIRKRVYQCVYGTPKSIEKLDEAMRYFNNSKIVLTQYSSDTDDELVGYVI